MRRVGSSSAAFAALVAIGAIAGCGDARPAAAPPAGQTGCSSCHTGPGEAPPFRDPTGSIDPARITVGAHDAHLHPGTFTNPISCSECHTTPNSVSDPGHLEDSPGDLRFGTLATTGGAEPTYTSPNCSAVYCHGNFPGGNAQPSNPNPNRPSWLGGPLTPACETCHGNPPPTGRHAEHVGKSFNGTPIVCATCHGTVGAPTHVNGVRDVILTNWEPQFRTCAQACHQPRSWGQ